MSLLGSRAELYPLLSDLEGRYEEAKAHARAIDQFLGLKVPEVELGLTRAHGGERAPWCALSPDVLLTPYLELRFMISKLELGAGRRVLEFGAGYARLAHVMAEHAPEAYYCGIELVSARFQEARRVLLARALPRAQVIEGDALLIDPLPSADVIFMYDLSPEPALTMRLLHRIQEVSRGRALQVVGRGRATRTLIERHHPWLSGVWEPRHFGNFSIYQS